VAGVLFLEPFYEGFQTMTAKKTIGGTLWQVFALARLALHVKPFYRRMFTKQFAPWPPEVRGKLVDYHLQTLRKTMSERKNLFTEIEPEVRDGGNLPDVPVIVLAATGIDPYQAVIIPVAQLRELNTQKAALYAPLAKSVPRGEYREVDDAGHDTLWTDRPDAVLQALRDLLNQIR
jgi:pimeloyl-ACP methyl ester carboxylesterase